jgi:cytoskeleton protein RodZ
MPQPGQIAGPTVAAPAAPAAVDASRIILRAKADAWMQVRDKAGQVILNRVLRAGETWPVPAKGGLLLTTGNAGGTEVLLDGTQTIGLGGEGAVRRDLPLDVEAIKDGKLSPPAAAPVRPVVAMAPLPATPPAAPRLNP